MIKLKSFSFVTGFVVLIFTSICFSAQKCQDYYPIKIQIQDGNSDILVSFDKNSNGNGHWQKLGNYNDPSLNYKLSAILTAITTEKKVTFWIPSGKNCDYSDYALVSKLRFQKSGY